MKKIIPILCLAIACYGFQSVSAQSPTVAAPVPTYDAVENNVKSWYSSAGGYNQIVWFVPVWGGEQVTPDYAEAGQEGECMSLTGLGYVALQHSVVNLLDNIDYFHVDLYANEATDFRIGLQTWASGENYFPVISYTTPGVWQSYDFPKQSIVEAGLIDPKETVVLRIAGNDGGAPGAADLVYANEIYLDNIIAYKGEPKSGIAAVENSSLQVYVANEQLFVHSDNAISNVAIYNLAGQKVLSTGAVKDGIPVANLAKGIYVVSVKLANGTNVVKKIVK
ncbi:MAG: hypothetical protein EZS26_002242 [Candidatus Ordinivivax streblomastigis]|uniref:Secretion system C-terminal sorting domain-containing protein n=1 Tax=Candidatus Ordinivivax streblomastigis TaxID=2540710 RepID=A0A5M8NZU3_9BACT|nr:MAG: hypothetical protein EZS26_002242 [Candidatus Ordinivivax streblomastigis]